MTMAERFEGRDLEPQVQEAMREIRREQWRASRGPFQRQQFYKAISVSTTPAQEALASTTSSDIERLKRIQVKVLVPKSNTPLVGWIGFLRRPEGLNVAAGDLDFGSPAVLRPIHWMANVDHATYWDAYLPAVNIADNGALILVVGTYVGTATLTVVARWVSERGLEG